MAAGSTAPLGKLTRSVEIARIVYENEFFRMLREVAVAERRPVGPGQTEVAIPPEMPYKVRRMLEELGPTFIKIGQLLGTRPDLVPAPFVEEFKNLYDKTTPTPFPAIRRLLENELGEPLDKMFKEFSEEPVASASIGQVHFAVLQSGEKVAVKVQHPDIEERVYTDFAIMEPMVRFTENLFAASRIWQPREHLLEVYAMLQKELDYRNEARTYSRVRENFRGDASVKIPKVYWEHSTKRVLTLERIEGIKLSDFESPEVKALDGKKLAEVITHAMAKQIFEDRLFHADPSPGNLMAISSDTVAFLDWGAHGSVTRRRSERIVQLITGFIRGDVEAVSSSLYNICNIYGEVDRQSFTRDVERIMDYHERERASVADPVVLDMIVTVARRHNMLLPADFLLINRALFQFEGMCKKLDPEFELVEVLEDYVVAYVRREMFGIGQEKEMFLDAALSTLDLVRGFPSRVNTLMRRLEQNELTFKVDLKGSQDQAQREERRSYRTSFTLLIGAILVGAALVLVQGDATMMLTFFVVATLFVLIWAFAMLYFSET